MLHSRPLGRERRGPSWPAGSKLGGGYLAIGGVVTTALRQDRLLFAFQPVICAATGKVDYFECLLRMRNEEGRHCPQRRICQPSRNWG